MNINKKSIYYLVTTFLICYLIQHYWISGANFFRTVFNAGFPFLIGAAIAYVVNIVMTAYEHFFGFLFKAGNIQQFKRSISMVMAYLTFILLIVWIFSIVLPDLISSINSLLKIDTSSFSLWLNTLNENEHVAQLLDYLGQENDLVTTLSAYGRQILQQVLGVLTGLLSSVSSVASTLLNVFVSLIFSLYVLGNKEQLGRQAGLLVDTYLEKYAKLIRHIVGIMDRRFHGFIVSQTLEAIILGTLTAIGMFIFRFPYAGTVGVLVAFTAIIPVIGAYIGTTIGFILVATQDFSQALWFLLYMVVLQQIEGNLIYPRVVGGSIGLPGMWVLVAITIGGALGGIGMMLISVPLAATFYQLIKEHVDYKQQKKN